MGDFETVTLDEPITLIQQPTELQNFEDDVEQEQLESEELTMEITDDFEEKSISVEETLEEVDCLESVEDQLDMLISEESLEELKGMLGTLNDN